MLNREIAGCILRETREGLGTWSRAHPHSGSALKRIYMQLNVNDLINNRTDAGLLSTLWVQAGAFKREGCLLLLEKLFECGGPRNR